MDFSCFAKLQELETQAIPQRIGELECEVEELRQKEARLQKYYASLFLPAGAGESVGVEWA